MPCSLSEIVEQPVFQEQPQVRIHDRITSPVLSKILVQVMYQGPIQAWSKDLFQDPVQV